MSVEANWQKQDNTWQLTEDLLQSNNGVSTNAQQSESIDTRLSETLFSQGNGYIGIRGTLEDVQDGTHKSCEGVYLNGLYFREPIPYGETAYGFATHNDKLLQVPNPKVLQVKSKQFTDELKHIRVLDMRTGVLTRDRLWSTDNGGQCQVQFQRFVSNAQRNLMCLQTSVKAVGESVNVSLQLGLDDSYGAVLDANDPRAGELSIDKMLSLVDCIYDDNGHHYIHSVQGIKPAQYVLTTCFDNLLKSGQSTTQPLELDTDKLTESAPTIGKVTTKLTIAAGSEATIQRFVLYQQGNNVAELLQQSREQIAALQASSYQAQRQAHTAVLSEFWRGADMHIASASDNHSVSGEVKAEQNGVLAQPSSDTEKMLQGLRFSMYQLYQSAGRDGKSAIAAKGLSGPGYDGHYFWDTEIYIVPFFALVAPDIAKQLLMYRFNTLPQARQRAKQMSHDHGALFAWRTISGEECSAFFPASTAQYHINAAVAYAIRTYFQATHDWQFMCDYGLEMLAETARLWAQLGHFNSAREQQFCIDGVTGPDEYTAIVNNNFYTNYMAQQHLLFAVEIAEHLQAEQPQSYALLTEKIALQNDELEQWRTMAERMYLPFDEERNLHPQDDSFLQKAPWDFAQRDPQKTPLLLHYHPLVIYRYQVLKQADVILAMLLGDDDFSREQKLGNLAYYEPLTTHDSTLSSCIHSMLHAEVGNMAEAYEFFGDSARMDLDNLHHNTEYGVHTACMAGAWNSVVFGFLGLRLRDNGLHLHPRMPQQWSNIAQTIQFQGRSLHISATSEQLTVTLLSGEPVAVVCFSESKTLLPQSPVQWHLSRSETN